MYLYAHTHTNMYILSQNKHIYCSEYLELTGISEKSQTRIMSV
jgi:hypothetical protein